MKTIKLLMAIFFVFLFCNIATASVNTATSATNVASLELVGSDAGNGELVNYKRGRNHPEDNGPAPVCTGMTVERRGVCVPAELIGGVLHRIK